VSSTFALSCHGMPECQYYHFGHHSNCALLPSRFEQNPNSRKLCTGTSTGTDACLQTYYRDFFPGQPFTNKETCTGSASRGVQPGRAVPTLLLFAVLSWGQRWLLKEVEWPY